MIIKVVCAIIIHDNKILAAKRGNNMPHSGYWEFPGGKIEDGENEQNCLRREIQEELNCEIIINKHLKSFTHDYPDKTIVLKPFICSIKNTLPTAIEHEKIEWFSVNDLDNIKWLPADIAIKNLIQTIYS